MGSFRVHKSNNFTIVNNYVFHDKTISWKAKGLLVQMLSLPDEWDYTEAGLAKLAKDGMTSTRSALKELEESKYLTRTLIRNESGRVTDVNYDIYEVPTDHYSFEESRQAADSCAESHIPTRQAEEMASVVPEEECRTPKVDKPSLGFPKADEPSLGFPKAGEPFLGFPKLDFLKSDFEHNKELIDIKDLNNKELSSSPEVENPTLAISEKTENPSPNESADTGEEQFKMDDDDSINDSVIKNWKEQIGYTSILKEYSKSSVDAVLATVRSIINEKRPLIRVSDRMVDTGKLKEACLRLEHRDVLHILSVINDSDLRIKNTSSYIKAVIANRMDKQEFPATRKDLSGKNGSFTDFTQRDYDYDQLEAVILQKQQIPD